MKAAELYAELKLRIDTIGKNKGFKITDYHMLLNEAQQIYFENLVKDRDNGIRVLHCLDVTLEKKSCDKDSCTFIYPDDFYQRTSQYIIANKCGKQRKLKVHITQSDDLQYTLEDPFWKPSYEWEETIATPSKEGLKVYLDDFTIDKLNINYYRKPKEIQIASCSEDKSYQMKSGRTITEDQFELCDKFQSRKILDIAAYLAEVDASQPDFNKFLNKILKL